MSDFLKANSPRVTDYPGLIKALIKAKRMIESNYEQLITYQDVDLIIDFLKDENQASHIFHIRGTSQKQFTAYNPNAPKIEGNMIKIGDELFASIINSSNHSVKGSDFFKESKTPNLKRGKELINNSIFRISVTQNKKQLGLISSLDEKAIPPLDIDILLKKAMELGDITQEQYQELQKKVEVENEQPNTLSGREDYSQRVAREFGTDLKNQKETIISALEHAKTMIESGFTERIKPEEFKIIVGYLNRTKQQSKVMNLYGNIGDPGTNIYALSSHGCMMKFGDTLVSLVEKNANKPKTDSAFLEPISDEDIVIGKGFDYDVRVSPDLKSPGIPINDWNEGELESLNIEELINAINKGEPIQEEGTPTDTRTMEENNIKILEQETAYLDSKIAALETERDGLEKQKEKQTAGRLPDSEKIVSAKE